MKIQSKIWLSIVVSVAVSGVLTFFVLTSVRGIGDDLARGRKYTEVILKAFALDLLVATFGQESGQRHIQQFAEVRASLTKLLDGLASADVREEFLIRQIQRNNQELDPLLDQFLARGAEQEGLQVEFKKMLATQLWTKVRFISDDTSRLMEISESRVASSYTKAGITVLFLLIALIAANVIISMISGRSIARTQEDLRKQREWLQVTLASIGDAVIAADVDGKITFMNPLAEGLTGWTFSEASQKPVRGVFNIINEHTRKEPENPVTKVLREGTIIGLANHTILIRKDGTEIPVDDSGAPIKDESGNISGIILVFHDITERKRAEEALRKEHDFTEAVLDTAGALVVVLDPDGRIMQFNRACETVTGYQEAEVLGRCFWEFLVPSDDLDGVLATWRRLQAGDFPNTHENQWLRKDGSRRLIAWSNTAIVHSTGEIRYIIGTGLDITERKRAEEERERFIKDIDENRRQLQALMDSIPAGVFIADATGKLLQVNEYGKKIWGGTVPLSGNWQEYGDWKGYWPDTGKRLTAEEWATTRALTRGETILGEIVDIERFDGSKGTVLNCASAVKDADGNVIGSITINLDITEQRRAEEALNQRTLELQHLTETLEQRVEERTEELANLSSQLVSAQENERRRVSYDLHDNVWQMLLATRFEIEHLFSGQEDWAALRNKSKQVMKNIVSLVGKIRSMQGDLWPYVLEDLGLAATIDWYCREFEKNHPGLVIEIKNEFTDGEIPSSAKIVIYRILQETLENVAKHSHASHVTLHLIKRDPGMEFDVEDNGIGFNPEETVVKRAPWGGLGLLGIKARTELSGGIFGVESAKGKGTTVRASWPL